jgi:hypothetical protein
MFDVSAVKLPQTLRYVQQRLFHIRALVPIHPVSSPPATQHRAVRAVVTAGRESLSVPPGRFVPSVAGDQQSAPATLPLHHI